MWIASSTSPAGGAGPSATSSGSIPRALASAGLSKSANKKSSRRSIATALVGDAQLVEVRAQPPLGFLERHFTAPGIILELVATNARDTEILAVPVAEVETRHGRGRK